MVELVRAGRHGPRILRFDFVETRSREILRADQRLTLIIDLAEFGAPAPFPSAIKLDQ